MRKRFFSLFAVLTLFFVAVGCGDDDPEPAATDDTEAEDTTPETTEAEEALALEDWAEEADDICADTDEAMGELEEPTSVEDIDAAIAFLEDAVEIQQDQLDALTELGAPDDEADAAEEALGLLSDQIEVVETAIADVEDGADLEEVIAGLNEEGDDIKADLTDLAEDLGLEVCGADSGTDEPTPTTIDSGSSDEPFTYGDDPDLDALWEACEAGDADACDTLWSEAPVGSEYEDFGFSCGFQVPEGEVASCSDVLATSSGDPFEYGDDAVLDELWDACDGGDGQACDDLYFQSPFDSEYEAFGNTCGGRVDESEAGSTYCADVM